ncbi:MAG: hypothetical protein JNM31_14050 [Flavobacteriales bacterium]|nr:hypothetical protein [Flavobacteriales bacterium]
MRQLVLPCLLLAIASVRAQFPLPYYETWDSSSLLISRDTAAFLELMRMDHLLAVGPLAAREVRIRRFRTLMEDECCTDADPVYLIAELAERIDTTHWSYLPSGEMEQVRFALQTLASYTLPDTLLPFTHPEPAYQPRWIWRAEGTDHRLVLQRVRVDGSVEDEWPWMEVRRSRCQAWQLDDLTWVRCPGAEDTLRSLSNIGIEILMSPQGPVHVFLDYSQTTLDGWGPFHWAQRRPMAMIHSGAYRSIILNSGEVLVQSGGRWLYTHREPVRYYGECDCPEDD